MGRQRGDRSTKRNLESWGVLSLGSLRGSFLGMGRVLRKQASPELSSEVFMVGRERGCPAPML